MQGFDIAGRPQTHHDYALDEIEVECQLRGISGKQVQVSGHAMWKDRDAENSSGTVNALIIAWVE